LINTVHAAFALSFLLNPHREISVWLFGRRASGPLSLLLLLLMYNMLMKSLTRVCALKIEFICHWQVLLLLLLHGARERMYSGQKEISTGDIFPQRASDGSTLLPAISIIISCALAGAAAFAITIDKTTCPNRKERPERPTHTVSLFRNQH
jgi:hypothetical protein